MSWRTYIAHTGPRKQVSPQAQNRVARQVRAGRVVSTQLGRPLPTSAADGTSTVAVVALAAHELSGTRRALKTLLDLVAPSISAIIRPGDRVLVKPAVRCGSVTNPSSGLTSNPILVRAVIEALIDCGARVSLGDYRPRPRDGVSDPQVEWMREVSASTGATLVSFLASGARVVRGRLLYPRRYPSRRRFWMPITSSTVRYSSLTPSSPSSDR